MPLLRMPAYTKVDRASDEDEEMLMLFEGAETCCAAALLRRKLSSKVTKNPQCGAKAQKMAKSGDTRE